MENVNRTKVITGKNTRLSYFHGWEPVSINGGAEKYSVSVLIPKDDIETINAINAAVDAAIEEGIIELALMLTQFAQLYFNSYSQLPIHLYHYSRMITSWIFS